MYIYVLCVLYVFHVFMYTLPFFSLFFHPCYVVIKKKNLLILMLLHFIIFSILINTFCAFNLP